MQDPQYIGLNTDYFTGRLRLRVIKKKLVPLKPAVLHAAVVATHEYKYDKKRRRKPKTVTPFPKWDIDMTNNFVTSLDYAHIHKPIIFVATDGRKAQVN